jgi:hypothetical protein
MSVIRKQSLVGWFIQAYLDSTAGRDGGTVGAALAAPF